MTTNTTHIVPAPATGASNDAQLVFQEKVKPLIDIPDVWLRVIIIAAILLLCLAAWLLWRYLKKKAANVPPIPVVPPHIRARRALDAALALISEPKPFTIAVSGAVRGYLEQRFNFHAPDRTTEEFLYELQGTNLLTADQKLSLGDFLANCDLIKFAKYVPTETELRALHSAAVRLVAETEPRMVPTEIGSSVASASQTASQ